jgi:hypothetical protein
MYLRKKWNVCFIVLTVFFAVNFTSLWGEQAKWTFMVYLDADNNLEEDGIDDFMEMSSVGSNSDVNIVVLFDRIDGYSTEYGNWEDTRRGIVNKGDTPSASWGEGLGELNMGNGSTLTSFINWGTATYPADNYALVLWNHGGGWRTEYVTLLKSLKSAASEKEKKQISAKITEVLKKNNIPQSSASAEVDKVVKAVCWDDTNGSDCLYIKECQEALNAADTDVNLIGFDACLMSMTEVAYQLRDTGPSVMVTSEETEPGGGWPYDTLLTDLTANPTATPAELGTYIVDRYYASYGNDNTQSAVDLHNLSSLALAVTDFADTLIASWNSDEDAVKAKAQLLINSLESTVIHNRAGVPNYSGAHGLAINFPTDGADASYNDGNISFAGDTSWATFLNSYSSNMLGSWVENCRIQTLEFADPNFVDLYDFCEHLINYVPPSTGYIETQETTSEFIGGGAVQEWNGDEEVWTYTIPFNFKFYKNSYTTVYISSNGYLDFADVPNEYTNSTLKLIKNKRIAPLWEDLETEHVYIHQPSPDSLCIRWAAYKYGTTVSVNMEVVLYNDGRIKFNYGSGNTGLTSTIGLSAGEDNTYDISQNYNGESNLTNAKSLLFTPIINTLNLSYTAGANGSITGTLNQEVDRGSDGTPVTAVPDTGYHFLNWSDGSTVNPRTDTNVEEDISVTANFAPGSYTLTYNTVTGGTITGTTTQSVNHGEDGTAVTAVPSAGYHFVNWSDNINANPRTDTNVMTDISVTANFAENILTVVIDSDSISENGGASTATVSRNTGTIGDLTVDLSSDDTSEALVPATAVIPDGSSSVSFNITAVDDNLIDGLQSVTISASATGYTSGSDTIGITDDDTPGFTVTPGNLSINEDGGTGTFNVVLTAQPDTDVLLNVTNSTPAEATVSDGILTFTSLNWETPHVVTVTAVDDTKNGTDFSVITLSVDDSNSDNNFDSLADKTIYVTCVDDDPTAVDDTAVAGTSIPEVIDVLANDTDPQGDSLTIVAITTPPVEGTAVITDSGKTITYTAGTVCGTVTFVYQISDGNGGVSEATVTLNVGEKVAYGTKFIIRADNLTDFARFTRKPKIYAYYFDPVKRKDKKVSIKTYTKVPAKDGVDVTELECEWRRNVQLYNKKDLAAVNKRGIFTSTWIGNEQNISSNIVCRLNVQTVFPDGTPLNEELIKKLILTPPVISSLEKWDGTSIGNDSLHTNSVAVIKGRYFGSKAPKVWMEYLDGAKIRKQMLKVDKIYRYADIRGRENRSCMDVLTGESEIRVIMPKKWWKTWSKQAYDIIIDNKVGLASVPVNTIDTGNSLPVILPDTFEVTAGSKKNQLDILSNDSDRESDNVIVVLDITATSGKVKYDKKTAKIQYTPIDGFTGTDTFKYTLNDGHSDETAWPAPVTVSVNVVNP